jgi:hypothetical protein
MKAIYDEEGNKYDFTRMVYRELGDLTSPKKYQTVLHSDIPRSSSPDTFTDGRMHHLPGFNNLRRI